MTNIDQLTYYYDDATRPDLLTRVTDAASATTGFKYLASATSPHYTYDLNGNLTLDKHKTITFTYNHLNLPNTMTLTGGSAITMTYTADGEKLTKVSPAGTRNYVAGIEYLGANTEAIYHAEGRCTPNGASAFHYEYTLKDHLGNARVNFRANGAAVTYLEDFHYYPFGMQMEGIGAVLANGNDYRYNGKELNEDLGLNLYDYGARWYDPAVGRWGSVDPLAEAAHDLTPYRYGFNNPIIYWDPDGLFETRKEAREYKKENDEKGNIKKQEDRTYAIENKKNNTSIAKDTEFGVLKSVVVSANDVMSTVHVEGGFFSNPQTIQTLRDGTEREVPMASGVVDVGPGKALKGFQYIKTIGDKYKLYSKTRRARDLSGQARAVYSKVVNSAGKTVRLFKDSFKRDGNHYQRKNYHPNQSNSRKRE